MPGYDNVKICNIIKGSDKKSYPPVKTQPVGINENLLGNPIRFLKPYRFV